MSYSASTQTILAPNEAAALRQAIRRLRSFDIECKCKCSLIVSCVLDKEPECDMRRKEGSCDCRPRWLPTCILNNQTPHGCDDWREGHSCPCERMLMPRCLVTGCEQRQKGKHCECARTPVELCPHVLALMKYFEQLTGVEADVMARAWRDQQRRLLPKVYNDPPLPDRGLDVPAGPLAVSLMAVRLGGGRHIWHPDDDRGRPTRQMNQQLAGNLKSLLAAMKGVRHAA